MKRSFQILSGLLLGLLLVAILARNQLDSPQAPGAMLPEVQEEGDWNGSPFPSPRPFPEFTLLDQDGGTVTRADLLGAYQVVFFGYSHCPDVCPATLLHLTRAMTLLEQEGERIGGVLVTVDPERDTVERLKEYMAAFHGDIIALTGGLPAIENLTEQLGVGFAKVPALDPEGPTGAYTVDHTARSFVLDSSGMIVHAFSPFVTGELMAEDLLRLVREAP
jgi:protein SCO1/2